MGLLCELLVSRAQSWALGAVTLSCGPPGSEVRGVEWDGLLRRRPLPQPMAICLVAP